VTAELFHADRQTVGRVDRQTDRQTDRERETERQTDRQTERDRQTGTTKLIIFASHNFVNAPRSRLFE
jgi:hypothetical protein